MRRGFGVLAAAWLALEAQAAPAQAPKVEPQPAHRYLYRDWIDADGYGIGDSLRAWRAGLAEASKGTSSPAAVADYLLRTRPNFGLSRAEMIELVELWGLALPAGAPAGIPVSHSSANGTQDASDSAADELRRRFIALARATHQAPLVLEAAGARLNLYGSCRTEDLSALTDGAADRLGAAWWLMRSADCQAWISAFVTLYPNKATAALLLLYPSTAPSLAERLTLYAHLTRDSTLAHVAEEDRTYVSAALNRAYIGALFDAGLNDEAVAALAKLPAHVRAEVVGGHMGTPTVQVDGLPLRMGWATDVDDVSLELAAAHYLAGRSAQANAELAATEPKWVRPCFAYYYSFAPSRKAPRDCPTGPLFGVEPVMLDYLLHRPKDDPYPILEVYLSDLVRSSGIGTGVWTDVACRLLHEPQNERYCQQARARTLALHHETGRLESNAGFASAVDAAGLSGYEALRARTRAALDAAASRYGTAGETATAADARAPFVVGREPAKACSKAEATEQAAVGAYLSRRLGVGNIFVGLDTRNTTSKKTSLRSRGGESPGPNSKDRPIALEGPVDFSCLRTDRQVAVYALGDAPGSEAVWITDLTYNRARDRGFLTWQKGAVRLRLVKGRWVFDDNGE